MPQILAPSHDEWDGGKKNSSYSICSKCKIAWPETLEFFGPNLAKTNRLESWCRNCQRIRARETMQKRRITEPEKVKAEKERHRKSPQGRAWRRKKSLIENQIRKTMRLKYPVVWTEDLWFKCKQIWRFRCVYCQQKTRLVQDHFIPLCNPTCPGTVIWNIVPACQLCNLKKGPKDPANWLKDVSLLMKITAKLQKIAQRFQNVPNSCS